MPGQRSLADQQYYAHPRNVFWRIMGELIGAGPDLSYEQRLQKLQKEHIALWDVLGSCERPGSLDSDIRSESIEVNDFDRFFAAHDRIHHVFCNGGKAQQLFCRHVHNSPVEAIQLPSTSPAHAAMSYQDKLRHWSIIKKVLSD